MIFDSLIFSMLVPIVGAIVTWRLAQKLMSSPNADEASSLHKTATKARLQFRQADRIWLLAVVAFVILFEFTGGGIASLEDALMAISAGVIAFIPVLGWSMRSVTGMSFFVKLELYSSYHQWPPVTMTVLIGTSMLTLLVFTVAKVS